MDVEIRPEISQGKVNDLGQKIVVAKWTEPLPDSSHADMSVF